MSLAVRSSPSAFLRPSVDSSACSRAPRPLNPVELIDFTRLVAREVAGGAHDVQFDADERWHRRIYRDARVDVWLITWLTDQGTQLHDHGGSAGAFTVLSGTLSESVYTARGTSAGRLRESRHGTGHSIGFDARYVHDVHNLDASAAVSVHAYSTPLTAMNFYDLEGGRLVNFATLHTDDPEAVPPA